MKNTLFIHCLGDDLTKSPRSDSNNHIHKSDSHALLLILLFIINVLFKNCVYANTEEKQIDPTSFQNQQIALYLFPKKSTHNKTKNQFNTSHNTQKITVINSDTALSIFNHLLKHYNRQTSDPDYIVNDLRQLANYYAAFPDVISLLNTLSNENWQLLYSEDKWSTTAYGSIFYVEQAVIYFNTRTAAQLRLNNGCNRNPICIASPADTMLHELLHAHSMLVKTNEFIKHGGMSSMLYPYKHELSIIDAERKLYTHMSQHDAIKRPRRYEHTGRSLKTLCPTCIN